MSRSTDSALSRAPSSSSTGWKEPSERSSRRRRPWVPEEALGRHDDWGTLVLLERGLGAKQVEILGRRGEVCYAHVLVGGELEVSLQSRAGVFGALALVAVRQEQYEPRGLAPLRLAAHDELVDHGLPDVGEVPVLGLPED